MNNLAKPIVNYASKSNTFIHLFIVFKFKPNSIHEIVLLIPLHLIK